MGTVDRISVQISAEIGSLKRDLDQARNELRGLQGTAIQAADASTRAFPRMQRELQDISRAAGLTGSVMRGAFAAVAAYGVTYLAERIADVRLRGRRWRGRRADRLADLPLLALRGVLSECLRPPVQVEGHADQVAGVVRAG